MGNKKYADLPAKAPPSVSQQKHSHNLYTKENDIPHQSTHSSLLPTHNIQASFFINQQTPPSLVLQKSTLAAKTIDATVVANSVPETCDTLV